MTTRTLKEILNPRQLRMAELVADGCKNREIAEEFGMTVQTVKNQLHTVFDEVGCWSRHELAMRFIREHQEKCTSELKGAR